jgi:hypothetical protein
MDESTTPAPAPREPRQLSTNAKIAIGSAIVLFLFLIQFFASNFRSEAVKMEMFARGVNAHAALLTQPFVERDARKLRDLALAAAGAGDYASVTLADPKGRVLASTDRTMEGQVLAKMVDPPADKPRLDRERGRLVAIRAIVLGTNNVIGGLRVELPGGD